MMITEERLQELEREGRSAMPMRAELQELAAAYRARVPGFSVRRSVEDALSWWLHFEAPSGRRAALSVDTLVQQRGPLTAEALREWADALTPNVAGNRLAEGKSELTGLLGGPTRSEKE